MAAGFSSATLAKSAPLAFDDDIWELYDTTADWSQACNLAKEHPQKLHELQRLWLIEAAKHNVLPLDDRGTERMDAAIAGRPQLITGNTQLMFPGMGRLTENTVLNVKNRSYSVTAQVELPETPASGVLLSQGGYLGGWSFYADAGVLKYAYNFIGLTTTIITSTAPLPSGRHQLRAEFAYDGGGFAKGGDVTLYIDGAPVGRGRVEATQPIVFSADESSDVGTSTGTPVTTDPGAGSPFTGSIEWVRIDIGDDDHNHLILPEDAIRSAIARQ